MADAMLLGESEADLVDAQSHLYSDIEEYIQAGMEWNAFFCNVSWLPEVRRRMRRANDIWEIARGERRGWNALFYPHHGHPIEAEYIRSVLRSSNNVRGLVAHPNEDAFCCSESMDDLERAGKFGTLAWIHRFEQARNNRGRPLPAVLARAGQHWYEMRPETMADVVISMNPGPRLLVIRLGQRAFVDQRLIRFLALEGSDIEICHALMNSILGLFYLEALGFGRGLGALDLNATKLHQQLHILDPDRLSALARAAVLDAFAPLLERDIEDLDVELRRDDRHHFDQILLNAYGLSQYYDPIRDSLLKLHGLRCAVRT